MCRQCLTSSRPYHYGGHKKLENSISCHVAVAAYHSQIIQASYYHIFGYAAERWFRRELVGADIPCWPNYYSLLGCHIRSTSETTGSSLPASSGDGDEHRLALWSWLSRNVSWTGWSANGCQMFASVSVVRDFCQYILLWIWADDRFTFDRLWLNFIILSC